MLVINPLSRSGAQTAEAVLAELDAAGAKLAGGAPVAPQGLESTLAALGPGGAELILVGGGDGTLNRVLPVLLGAGLPLGVLPLGTANDFANALGIPSQPREAVRVALGGRTLRVDVGRVNGRPFLNVGSLGLGVRVTQNLSAELKARLGFLAYPRTLLATYRDTRSFRAWIAADGAPPLRMRCIHIGVGNSGRFGGGAVISQSAGLDSGLLHLLALAPLPLWRLILLAPWLATGRARDVSGALSLDASRIRVETSRRLRVSADGEILAGTPALFDILPGALPVMVPADDGTRSGPP